VTTRKGPRVGHARFHLVETRIQIGIEILGVEAPGSQLIVDGRRLAARPGREVSQKIYGGAAPLSEFEIHGSLLLAAGVPNIIGPAGHIPTHTGHERRA